MQKLTASLGLRSAIFVVISVILGSGVFKKVAMMAATLQSPLLVLLCWVLAGIISLAGALCTAEMAGMNFHEIADICGTSTTYIENTYYHPNAQKQREKATVGYDVDDDGNVRFE